MKLLKDLIPLIRDAKTGRLRSSNESWLALAKVALGIAVWSGALTPDSIDGETTAAVAELIEWAVGGYILLRGVADNRRRHRQAEEQVEAQG